jgi:hypothetical protein
MNSAFYLISYFAAGDSLRSSTPSVEMCMFVLCMFVVAELSAFG